MLGIPAVGGTAQPDSGVAPNPPDDEFVMVGASGPRSAAPSPLPPMLFELLGFVGSWVDIIGLFWCLW